MEAAEKNHAVYIGKSEKPLTQQQHSGASVTVTVQTSRTVSEDRCPSSCHRNTPRLTCTRHLFSYALPLQDQGYLLPRRQGTEKSKQPIITSLQSSYTTQKQSPTFTSLKDGLFVQTIALELKILYKEHTGPVSRDRGNEDHLHSKPDISIM